jgi:hypothetical protein
MTSIIPRKSIHNTKVIQSKLFVVTYLTPIMSLPEEEIASIRIGRTPLLYPRPIEALYNSEDSMRGRAAGK